MTEQQQNTVEIEARAVLLTVAFPTPNKVPGIYRELIHEGVHLRNIWLHYSPNLCMIEGNKS